MRGAQGGTNLKSLQSKTLISCVAIGLLAATCLAACGGQRESESQQGAANEAPSAASISAWSYADDCSLCHAAESNSLTDPACLAGIHAANGNTCQTCHADESDLAVVHEGANAEKAQKVTKLRKTGIKQDACLGCPMRCLRTRTIQRPPARAVMSCIRRNPSRRPHRSIAYPATMRTYTRATPVTIKDPRIHHLQPNFFSKSKKAPTCRRLLSRCSLALDGRRGAGGEGRSAVVGSWMAYAWASALPARRPNVAQRPALRPTARLGYTPP